MDHSETIAVDIAGKEVLPEFKPHKFDVGLDKEPTMFDLMNGIDGNDDENDDFKDDEDDFSDDEEEPGKLANGGAAVVPTESKVPVAEDDDDDADFVIAD